jgi:crotonobetainyl-CoA:carnitine CoA-transferase CaiB-like acyl-CoA transferase
VQTGASLARDPHILAREVFQTIEHPLLGELEVVRPPWRMEGARLSEPSPLLGQHNDYVLGEILGLDDAEIERLIEAESVF